jgi:hypothetical protein
MAPQSHAADALERKTNKNSFIHIRDEGIPPRYHPDYVRVSNVTLAAVTGSPVDDYCSSPSMSPAQAEMTGEFGLLALRGRREGLAPDLPFSLAG